MTRDDRADGSSVAPHGLSAVLFDYGGTLDGDADHWFDHFVRLYEQAGNAADHDRLKQAFYHADESLTRDPMVRTYGLERMVRTHVRFQLAHLGLASSALAAHLAETFIADTRRAWDRNRPVLRRLAARFRLGVVSNAYGNMPALLAEADLAPFEIVLDSSLVGIAKPDPDLYALAARRLAVPAHAILHVGDSWERDVVPADAIGMHTAWLARPQAATPPAPPAVWRIASLHALEMLLP